EEIDAKSNQFLNLITNITALLNSTYLIKGPYNIENEINDYKYIPDNYLKKINLITKSNDIKVIRENIKELILDLNNEIDELNSNVRTKISNDDLKGFYEEVISNYNKLKHACESEDYLKAYFTAHVIIKDIKYLFGDDYKEYNFPDLIRNINKVNLTKLKKLIIKHEEKLVEIIIEKDVDINRFNNINEFISSI
ncbi:MAG: hypothetical protein ACQEQH_06805, partial [Bacillota bacterium]